MVCDSTYILDQEIRHDTKIEEVMSLLDEVLEAGEEKVVVFSQWERMTRLIASELNTRKTDFGYLHGGIPGQDRGKLFTRFNEDSSCRIFLSTDAGGVGLNLQSGSIVINLDIPWNPEVLEQRIDRVHRLGQRHNVTVINMVSAGTIEEPVLDGAEQNGLLPSPPPLHIPTLEHPETFWSIRDGSYFIDSSVQKIPGIMFMVVAGAQEIIMIIYDMFGRAVDTRRFKGTSGHPVTTAWDGNAYPSGIYYYQIRSGKDLLQKKMCLIK
jgi:hypothetical protein